jgi:hypothetical protein
VSVFLGTNHLFLRTPGGNVEDVLDMRNAGFGAIFCNIGDDAGPEDWAVVRDRALTANVVCGPWLRTCGEEPIFDPESLLYLIEIADHWGAPLIVNSENELDHTGREVTEFIAHECGSRDWALSTLPFPMDAVDYSPIKVPVLPQAFGPYYGSIADDARAMWHHRGVRCVVDTYGTYEGWTPDMYALLSPYGLFTADDCASDYRRWSPRGVANPCMEENGGDVQQQIGSQHGVTAAMNRLRDLDPKGTLLQKQGGKWPSLSNLQNIPVSEWKAYDKLERSLTILVQDHDEAL